jgi:CHAT domain-containing protein
MAARDGSTFDADAQTALAQADSEAERQAVHDALRIKARRDQLERRELRAAADRMINPAAGADLTYTARLRDLLQAASDHIAATDRGLAGSRAASAGANLVALKRLQAALGPDEAALRLTMIPSGFAYACVRRDLVQRRVLRQDLNQYILDLRIVQAALTAGHAPSEAMDTQFPVSAAVRLHQALIQPFDGCLRPGDRILWISGISSTAIPLSVFLERAPPKLADGGYDLAAADWLMRRHVVSYPGSAGFIVAARSTPRPATALDFLGVGDPVLKPVAGGPDLSALAALPETKDELKASAKGFSKVKLMLGEAATEAAVRREPLSEYRFLSFATHGLMRGELEGLGEPALALTPVSATRGNDGLLTASEIADLTLAARFVALSACNTANFDLGLVSGELSALSSAFAMAGAPSVLGTMWPVDSETGERVVAATFQALAAAPDTDPAEALAKAQRAFLAAPPSRAYAHPRFWAPFVVLGDGGGSQTALR